MALDIEFPDTVAAGTTLVLSDSLHDRSIQGVYTVLADIDREDVEGLCATANDEHFVRHLTENGFIRKVPAIHVVADTSHECIDAEPIA